MDNIIWWLLKHFNENINFPHLTFMIAITDHRMVFLIPSSEIQLVRCLISHRERLDTRRTTKVQAQNPPPIEQMVKEIQMRKKQLGQRFVWDHATHGIHHFLHSLWIHDSHVFMLQFMISLCFHTPLKTTVYEFNFLEVSQPGLKSWQMFQHFVSNGNLLQAPCTKCRVIQ